MNARQVSAVKIFSWVGGHALGMAEFWSIAGVAGEGTIFTGRKSCLRLPGSAARASSVPAGLPWRSSTSCTPQVGINLADVVFDEGDVFGDGVNVASRLQGLSRPGGICISDFVHQSVADRFREPFRDMGRQRVKNISRPIRVWQWTPDAPTDEKELAEAALHQRVQLATAPDGVQIAWASIGEGPPVLKAPNWLNHLEYEWRSPVWGPAFAELTRHWRLVRFDQRGNGLSDWEVEKISEEAMISDIATVADAAGLERFALLGISQGCAFSIRYAVQNPERVTCLVLLGGFVRGRLKRPDPEQKKLYEAGTMMIRDGWGSPNPVFRHFFALNFIPDARVGQGVIFARVLFATARSHLSRGEPEFGNDGRSRHTCGGGGRSRIGTACGRGEKTWCGSSASLPTRATRLQRLPS